MFTECGLQVGRYVRQLVADLDIPFGRLDLVGIQHHRRRFSKPLNSLASNAYANAVQSAFNHVDRQTALAGFFVLG